MSLTKNGPLEELYEGEGRIVVTAHRGFSAEWPENTLHAFQKAVEIGADIVEFDTRLSKDGVPVIMHDETLDRTTDGSGPVGARTLSELKKLNASYWRGPHDTGSRQEKPFLPDARVPTLEEALDTLSGRVFLNIQVYCHTEEARRKIAGEYASHSLYGRAFLMVKSFEDAEKYRLLDPGIGLCVGEDRGNLQRHKDFGLKFVQPSRNLVDKAFCGEIKRLGFCANMFYSNTAGDNLKFLSAGMKGIMTDNPLLLLESVKNFKSGRVP